MSAETIKTATALTEQAKATLSAHAATHGDAESSLRMVAQLWTVWVLNSNVIRHGNPPAQVFIDERDVAEMMSLLKKARVVHGTPGHPENYIDDIAYTALAGGLIEPAIEAAPQRVGSFAETMASLDKDLAAARTKAT